MAEAFASNFVAPLGPQLDAFESGVRDYLGADVHCVGLSSGSAALHQALRIAGVGTGRGGLDFFHDLCRRHLPG